MGITAKQLLAIDALLGGASRLDAAAAAGVDRSTLWRWMTSDAIFVAALNEARADVHQANIARLRGLAGLAIETLETALSSENENIRLGAAKEILKAVALADIPAPSGETDPAVLETNWTRETIFKQML